MKLDVSKLRIGCNRCSKMIIDEVLCVPVEAIHQFIYSVSLFN